MTWGLVLSGGAAYGLSNAGVLEVLEQNHLKPDSIAGSSMGAIIAGVYALGLPLTVIEEVCDSVELRKVAKWSKKPLKGGLHGGLLRQNLEEILRPHIGDATIGDCQIPFVCIAGWIKEPIDWTKIVKHGFTDTVIQKVERHIFGPETPLLDALLASSAIPVVFSPVEIDGKQYGDLCHFGAIPTRSLKETYNPDIIVATDTDPTYDMMRTMLPGPWKEWMERGRESLLQSKEVCDLIIEPKMPAPVFRFDKAAEFMKAGRIAATEKIDEVKQLIAQSS